MNWINWLLFVIYIVPALLSAGHALLNKRDSRSALAWIAICVTFPWAGPLLYFFFGINRISTRARVLQGKRFFRFPSAYERPEHEGQSVRVRQDLPAEFTELARISDAVTRRPLVKGNCVEPLHNGESAYPAMLAAIDSARDRVYFSTFIFASDATGQRFMASLTKALKRGVDVRVLIDGGGAWYSFPPAGRKIKKSGIRFARFLPPTLFPPSFYVNLRNHRKLLIVDGLIGFTGGMNIGDWHLAEKAESSRRTIDLHFRLQGPVVSQMEETFLEDWAFSTGEQSSPVEWRPTEEVPGTAICRTFLDGPNEDMDKLTMILISSISVARKKISIMTPYFLPPRELVGALQSASLRGVDVTLILPGKNNQPLVHWATRNMLWELIQWGVKVYYQPPPFVHTKLFIADDHYMQIGSSNLDPRSLRLNFELVVEVYDHALAKNMATHVDVCRQRSHEVTLEELENRSMPVKVRDAFCWLFSPYL